MAVESLPDWRWFWGIDRQPTREEAIAMLNNFNVSISSEKGLICMSYDPNLVATLHLYVAPGFRSGRTVAEMIVQAEKIAIIDGMRKMIAPLTEGNPFLRGGKAKKFGYELEGILKKQILVNGEGRSLFLYGKLLQQNSPFNKKE